MYTIEIDFDVFKAITSRRTSESITPNDVLRELFGLKKQEQPPPSLEEKGKTPWITKGITFPHGTEFRATHKGKIYYAVVQEGALLLDGKKYYSSSNAAGAITGNAVNGWIFWECKLPGSQEWKLIKLLRPR
jgi:negative regulator of replication initiation